MPRLVGSYQSRRQNAERQLLSSKLSARRSKVADFRVGLPTPTQLFPWIHSCASVPKLALNVFPWKIPDAWQQPFRLIRHILQTGAHMSEKVKWFLIVLLFAIGVPLIIGLALCLIESGQHGRNKDYDSTVLLSILVGIWIGIMLVLHIKGFFKSLKTSEYTIAPEAPQPSSPPTTPQSTSTNYPVKDDLSSVTRGFITTFLIILAIAVIAFLVAIALGYWVRLMQPMSNHKKLLCFEKILHEIRD